MTSGPTPLAGHRSSVASARLIDAPDGRMVSTFRIEGGKHVGAIGPPEGQVLERAIRHAAQFGIPVVGTIASSGADVLEGVSSLHAWGRVAKALADASGVVPTVLIVIGPCVSGPALLLGLADITVMTDDAFAYVSGPDTVRDFTGIELDHRALGGPGIHDRRSGVDAPWHHIGRIHVWRQELKSTHVDWIALDVADPARVRQGALNRNGALRAIASAMGAPPVLLQTSDLPMPPDELLAELHRRHVLHASSESAS